MGFAYSIYADSNTAEGLCVDEIESVGVDMGVAPELAGAGSKFFLKFRGGCGRRLSI